ncbi:hypothetical protein [Bradyrhizobium sp. Gha]|uniref:ATP-dependent DNA ligase n=1 Tax=Bradyrhizobium sp. Gha TaxID=1855318 RepID=UPI001FCD52B9|nr:hypothetical protein [Bradyrhizobium sp. Gha]
MKTTDTARRSLVVGERTPFVSCCSFLPDSTLFRSCINAGHARVLQAHGPERRARWPRLYPRNQYDGYRLRVEGSGRDARLITRGGHNWTSRFPWIAESTLKNREQQLMIDGEAVVLGVDGVSDFDALHSRWHDAEVRSTPSTSSRSAARICARCR